MDEFNFKSLESLVTELKEGVFKINSGALSAEDILSLLDSSRQLHERLAVLQYLLEKAPKKETVSEQKKDEKSNNVKENQINLMDVIVEEEAKTEKLDINISTDFKSVNEIHSDSPQTSLADQFGQQPISDLTKEIGINEKYLITENLFFGDNQAYLTAIKALNEFQNMDQASDFLKNSLSKKYNWNPKSNQLKRLINLVERRYHIK
tara:strand:- start:150 stop:770 length:621 start_codon:yes stop_codon:yes gene_type:complete